MHLDNLNRELLNKIQHGFPVVPEPYKDLANQLGIMEEEVINRLRAMIDAGVIRRLGGIFDSRQVGYTGTLCALKVPEDRIESVAEVINEYSGITHNYLRDHEYNMWFTLLAESTERIDQILGEIRERTKIEEILSLPASRIFKIKVNFKVAGESKC